MVEVCDAIVVDAAASVMTVVGEAAIANEAGPVTVKLTALELPPPGIGLVTVMDGLPDAAISAAVIDAVNLLELTRVVTLTLLFKFTVAPLMKFDPFTVNVNAGPPCGSVLGEIELIIGTGLLMVYC